MAHERSAARRDQTKREAILRAATRVFLDEGYDGASMDAIASRAGVSKATVYGHFGSKEALFEAIIRDLTRTLIRLPMGSPASANPAETLTALARRFVEILLDPASLALYRVLIAAAPRNATLARISYRTGAETIVRELAEYLANETARGTLAVADPTLAAEQFFGQLRGHLQLRALLRVEDRPPQKTLERFVDTAVAAFLRAYAPTGARRTRQHATTPA
jgi:TetR/AcrR family transcriptional repressor of mexJK operon